VSTRDPVAKPLAESSAQPAVQPVADAGFTLDGVPSQGLDRGFLDGAPSAHPAGTEGNGASETQGAAAHGN
jgi:hypothetical protein